MLPDTERIGCVDNFIKDFMMAMQAAYIPILTAAAARLALPFKFEIPLNYTHLTVSVQ
jgi:hypothetical protein